ncbi:MAG TPA: CDP-alcohol phosphatidyltransferase family protein, partial [Micromonosporaceae bacterium]
SFARLLGVPVFLYLILGPHYDVAAVIVLAVGGSSDWIDGYLARRLNQVSRLGELMDPFADRLYIFATLLAFAVRGVIPWLFLIAILARDLMLTLCLFVLRRYGYGPPPVHYLGKTATFILLCSFPMLLLAKVLDSTFWYATGWAFAWWGIVLYWIAAGFYLYQVAGVVRSGRRAGVVA